MSIYGSSPDDSLYQKLDTALTDVECDCVVALGKAGLDLALANTAEVVIFSYGISPSDFFKAKAEFPERELTALYSTPNPKALILLAQAIFKSEKLALFYSERTAYLENKFNKVKLIKTHKSRIRKELARIDDVKAVIAIPDLNIWNKQSFRIAIRSLYRRKKALIGFNKSLAKGGAIASLYTKEEDLIRQFIRSIKLFSQNSQTPSPSYPDSYRVAVNKQIARTINISIPSTVSLMNSVNAELRHE